MTISKIEIFNRIEKIDQKMSIDGVDISHRLIKAMIEYKHLYNVDFILFGADADLSNHRKYICEWYDLTYKSLQNIKTSSYMVMVKNNPYEIYIPIIFGTVSIHWKFFLSLNNLNSDYSLNKLNFYSNVSIRNSIIGLTNFVDAQLKQHDVNDIMNFVKIIIDIDLFFNKEYENDSIRIAQNDLIASKEYMLKIKNYDMVAWQCLQCVEKLLKEYIVRYKEITPKKIHDLEELAKKAEITDEELLSLLKMIKATPSSRYELKDNLNNAISNYKNTIFFIHKFIKLWT